MARAAAVFAFAELTHDFVAAEVWGNAARKRGNATFRIDCESGFCTEHNETTVSTSHARRGITSTTCSFPTRTA